MPKRIIISGGMDPLHKGHIRLIKDAAQHGSVVIVLNSDEWLIRKKGRFFMGLDERRELLLALKHVDDVISMNDDDGTATDGIIQVSKKYPNDKIIFANGGDRVSTNVPEIAHCEKNNIEMLWNIGGKKEQSSSDLLHNWTVTGCTRDWGSWNILKDYQETKVKDIIVVPGKSLSYQRHQHRSEFWHIVQGKAKVWLNNSAKTMRKHQNVFIPVGTWHQLINIGPELLIVAEIQYGAKCIEEDIQRKENPWLFIKGGIAENNEKGVFT